MAGFKISWPSTDMKTVYAGFRLHLNPASVEFAEDARRQGRRRTTILQVLANTADSVKSALLKGKLFSKITTFMAASN
ncbi:MAG: hypothetical protein J7J52_00210, partial [Deltaproteobacteria bacterium]|nr:hypothetical protein [Deltaproteobacteria bacterium]